MNELTLTSCPSETREEKLLRRRIALKFQTITEDVTVSGVPIRFTRIADPNQVLDDIVAEEDRREKLLGTRIDDPKHLPYWAELWDSSLGVAFALSKLDLTSSTRILDLGCGMGLCGAIAASLGAQVLLADLEPPALLFARLNSLPFTPRTRVRQLNWQTDRLDEKFDLIIGADILYERKQWEFLNEFWLAHLAPGGSVLLGEPGRQSGELFIPWITDRKWFLRESNQELTDRSKKIRLFRLSRV